MKYDDCKRCPDRHGQLRYKLRNSRVWVSNFGLHHTGFLDPVSTTQHGPVGAPLDEQIRRSIENDLQFNRSRFTNQIDLVKTKMPLCGLRVLDVGCGGGLFLALLQQEGARVTGIELQRGRVEYARTVNGLQVETRPVEDADIQNKYRECFDALHSGT